MFLLDTDTYSHLLSEHSVVVGNATRAAASGEIVGVTVVTKIEVLRGWFEALLKADERARFFTAQRELLLAEEALQQIPVMLLNDTALNHFEELRATKGLRKIGRADLLIAAIVLAVDATLATRNTKHFSRIPRLKYVNWVD